MKAKAITAGLMSIAVATIMPATTFAGYAPSTRETYTCASPTVCEGADHVTFNSFTNAPNYGDERGFYDVRDGAITTEGGFLDTMKVTDGQKVTLRVYVHNNANPAKIGDDNATAKNVKVEVALPKSNATSATSISSISASNANPAMVSDTIKLTGDRNFTLKFDTAAGANVTYRPNGQGDFVTEKLTAANFTEDSGENLMTANFANWHGCFNYSALITVTAIVHMDSTPPPVTPPVTPPTTPPTTVTTTSTKPASLPNTGAGNVVAIAGVATVAGMVGYRRLLSRRLSSSK